MSVGANPARPPKPSTPPFSGLPDLPALQELKRHPQWFAWDYQWKETRGKWDKPPINAKTGHNGSSTDPETWAPYEVAERRAIRSRLAGVGFALSKSTAISGIDLDDCRNAETGELQEWARIAVERAGTYCEVSPSGTGLRFFVKGIVDVCKIDAAQVELYADGRYLTVTGQHVEGTPVEINETPWLIAYLRERAEQFQAATQAAAERAREAEQKRQAKTAQRGAAAPMAHSPLARPAPSTGERDPFWRNVCDRAMANLAAWVPALLPDAKPASRGGYRVTSRNLLRDLEEDLSITPQGIVDWGTHDMGDPQGGKRTPIDLVMEHGGAATPQEAALWLCERLGVSPDAMGFRSKRGERTPPAQDIAGRWFEGEEAPKPTAAAERTMAMHKGLMLPTGRDRLEITKALAPAPDFPVASLPPVMRGAIEAIREHVQAPLSLCAHSVLSAAALVTQGCADVQMPGLPVAKPLSLFMLAIAVSGERKSACDDMALKAVAEKEADLRARNQAEMIDYKAARAAFEAQRKKIEGEKNISFEERKAKLLLLTEPPEPLAPVIRSKEANLEGLFGLLNVGQPGIGIFTSEGGQFLGGHGMSEDAKTRTITGLSELWDSGSAQRVRAKERIFLEGRRLSISLAAQPKIASALLGDELAKDQGFVGRFLVTMPESTIGTREIRETNVSGDGRLLNFYRQCRRVMAVPPNLRDGTMNELAPPTIHLDNDAKAVWRALAQTLEEGCAPGGQWLPVRSGALKMAENAARIAAILTLFENPDAIGHHTQATAGKITGEAMAAAAEVAMFYLKEALRITGHSVLDPETQALADTMEWLQSKYGTGGLFIPSMIQQFAPAHLRVGAEKIRERVLKLCEFGGLEPVDKAVIGGKPRKEAYRITGEDA